LAGSDEWREWRLPGYRPRAYAVYVDDTYGVWLGDFGANAFARFDPAVESFTSFALPSNPGDVRRIHGRPGEIWGAESAADKLVVGPHALTSGTAVAPVGKGVSRPRRAGSPIRPLASELPIPRRSFEAER
jgi:streptogramin lyase